jgi:ubiquinone/menaquinone biosynthesis C-methylase UbiE
MKWLQRRLFAPVLETKARRLSRELVPHLRNARRVLDFGCGDMFLTRRLRAALPQAELVGLDVLDTNLTELSPVLYDGTRIPFEDGHFDHAVVVFSLHHCHRELDALAELRRVTAGPVLVIEELYQNALDRALTCAHDWVVNRVESWKVPIPFHFHTDAEWRRAFLRLGWTVALDRRVYQLPALNLTHQRLYLLHPAPDTVTTVPSRAIA